MVYTRITSPIRFSWIFRAYVLAVSCACAQDAGPATVPNANTAGPSAGAPNGTSQKTDKRVFGILPNYRSTDASLPFQPIGTREKWIIAAKDSFDWPLLFVAGGFAGLGQLTDQNSSLGQGIKGYGNRYVRSYADLAMGNLLTEGLLPSLFRQDPRYFRRGTGGFWSRVAYATSRIFVTKTDSGRNRFNSSEVLGNSIAVGISNAYYPDMRKASDNVGKLTFQLANDAFSNVLKEFWPDIKNRLPGGNKRNRASHPSD